MSSYVRPVVDEPVFRDADGVVIDYGNRWHGSPPEDTYSVDTHPERFAPLHVVADARNDGRDHRAVTLFDATGKRDCVDVLERCAEWHQAWFAIAAECHGVYGCPGRGHANGGCEACLAPAEARSVDAIYASF